MAADYKRICQNLYVCICIIHISINIDPVSPKCGPFNTRQSPFIWKIWKLSVTFLFENANA